MDSRTERALVGRPRQARRAAAWAALGLLLVSSGVTGCGEPPVSKSLAGYREHIEAILERSVTATTPPSQAELAPALPRRRLRRIDVSEQRMGPFDFLSLIGCTLSERMAERNGALGRVLVPTRRLAHELRVLEEGKDCLPTLRSDRAERLAALLDEKRGELGAHVWNAIWLDEEVERFLGGGPATWIGGEDPNDAATRIRTAARLLQSPAEAISANALEAELAGLRDDPALGPALRELVQATQELARATTLLREVPATDCDRRLVRLSHAFEERYLPLQPALGRLDRRSREPLESLATLYAASARRVDPPEAMQRFAESFLGVTTGVDAATRFRNQNVEHADAWHPILVECGILEEIQRDASRSSRPGHPPERKS